MEIDLTDAAKSDLKKHKRSGNKVVCKKIENLLLAIADNPYDGIGQPEELKHDLTGFWSRRINLAHRIIYSVDEKNQLVTVHSLVGHYEK
jgi:toxin YoeB